jgi:hypothetical protein
MTTASRFMSAISSRFNPTTPTSPAIDDNDNDELCNLDISAALFPHGTSPSSPRDTFSPAAFKNLQMNATGLLTKMQAAYRERSAALRDLQAERSAQRDELEEAETRAQHLKMQLEGMARKAQEHEGVVKALLEELAGERRARAKAEERGLAVVAVSSPSEGASIVSEDLGVDEDRRRRSRKSWKSGGGGVSGADSEEDENESAESESVFSRCRSPALLPLPPTPAHTTPLTPDGFPVMDRAGTPHVKHGGGSVNATPKQKPGQQMNAFQKILKGISGEDSGVNGCTNCKGQDASIAWDTVGVLRDENRHLKTRVGELEVAVEGALDLVNGIGL